MKVELLKENLLTGLNSCLRFIPNKPLNNSLLGIVVLAGNGVVTLFSSDGDSSLRTVIGAKVIDEGRVCIPAKQFFELVSSFSEGKVTLTSDKENVLLISSETTKSKINCFLVEDYPLELMSEAQFDKEVVFPASVLADFLQKTIFCVSSQESKPILTGVYFQLYPFFKIAATDLFRLSSLSDRNISLEVDPFVLPLKIANEIYKSIANKSIKDVKLGFSTDGKIRFVNEETQIYTRVINGNYPNYEKIIPPNTSFNIVVTTESLIRGVKIASVFGKESSNIIKFSFSDEKHLIIRSQAQTIGEQENVIDVSSSGSFDPDFSIAFNFQYLLDFLNNVHVKKVNIGFNSNLTPVIFSSEETPNWTHLIMPVKS